MSAAGVARPTSSVATRGHGAPEQRAWVEHLMGTVVSVHARGAGACSDDADDAVRAMLTELHELEAVFTTFRPDSQISRLQRGDLTLDEADEVVREVHRLCEAARILTDGAFDAWASTPDRPGVFDPTGLVKGWAVARAASRLDHLDHLGFAIGAGGDVLLRPGADDHEWLIGIEDPRDPSRVLATVPVRDGAVATSGVAARGLHIVDPRSGERADQVLSATVVGPSLMWADVYATAAVALGTDAVGWTSTLHGTSGLLVLAGGAVHRWSHPA